MNILAINNKTKNKNMATKKILTDIVSNGDIESTSFIKTDGTSSQFLKADGSVDTSTYALTSSIPSGNNIIDWTTDLGATNIHVNNYQKREISDTPTDGYSHIAISSNWAFDNVKTAIPSGAVFTDTTYDLSGYSTSDTQLSDEQVEDIMGAAWVSGTNNTFVYDDSNGTLRINSTNTQRGIDQVPVENEFAESISSNWAFDNVKTAVPANAVFTDTTYDLSAYALASSVSGTNTGDQDLSGLLLNTTDTLDGSLTVDGGTGVATSGGTLILKQKGDTISDGIAITSSNAVSHRIWKDSSGNLNMGGSGAGSSFKQDLSGNLTILGTTSAPKFYVSTAPATSAWVFHMRNSASTADSGLYFDAGHGNLLLRDTSNNLNVRLRGGGGDSYFLGDLAIGSDNASSGIGSTRILRVASNGNSEVNVDHTDGGVSSDIGLFSFSRAGDILAYTKASHDGATNSAFMSFHTQTAGGSFSNLTSNERMRITSIGRLGIGTTNPNQKLDIIGGTNAGLRISATDTTSNWRDISIRSYTSEAEADALPEGVHMFTTNPSSATGNAFSKYGGFVIQCREDGNSSFAVRVGASLAEAFFINHNAAATFLSTVTASNFILSSDKRLKENIKKVDNKHIDVDWKTFEMKSDNSQNRYGVIAQELEEVHPEFVRTDDKGMKSVAYIDLLIAKIAELEARLDKANI
jgi:hypothetical protein